MFKLLIKKQGPGKKGRWQNFWKISLVNIQIYLCNIKNEFVQNRPCQENLN